MLGINSVAALVMAGRSSEVQGWLDSSQVKATSSFELAYNTVCSPIQRNKYTDAELLLLSGRRTGQESLMEDNWPDEDIEIELSPIAVQLGYVQQRLGRKQDAIEAYVDMTKRDTAAEMALRLVRPARKNQNKKTKTAASKYEDDILKFCEESGLPAAQDDTQIQHSNETALGCLAESLTCEDLNDEIVNV